MNECSDLPGDRHSLAQSFDKRFGIVIDELQELVRSRHYGGYGRVTLGVEDSENMGDLILSDDLPPSR